MKWAVSVVLFGLMLALTLVTYVCWQGNTRTYRLAAVTAFVWACAFNEMSQWALSQP